MQQNIIAFPGPLNIHARPSETISSLAEKFSSDIILSADARVVNAKSRSSVFQLGNCGNTIIIIADGSDAIKAVMELTTLLYKLYEQGEIRDF